MADRKYTGWVGEYCSGRETIRTIDCDEGGDDKSCRETCTRECNKEKVHCPAELHQPAQLTAVQQLI